ATFTATHSAGIRPLSAYLKVIGDFTRWNGGLVFGCDDSAKSEFLNKRKAKGNIEGPGQSNSNLWFTSFAKPKELGPSSAEGAVWAKENVKANVYSEPFLFAGWPQRCAWVKNDGTQNVTYTFEIDMQGNNQWKTFKILTVKAGKSAFLPFIAEEKGEWIRVKTDKATKATVNFSYSAFDSRTTVASPIFEGLANVKTMNAVGGLLCSLGDNRRALGLLANTVNNGVITETGYYEMGDHFDLIRKDNAKSADTIRTHFAIPKQVIDIDNGSVLIIDDNGRRWRLPLGDSQYKDMTGKAQLRICREVATERDLFSCMGTFYELPAENADGFAKIRPIATHHFRINDYASYRGMLVMTGIDTQSGKTNQHVIVSNDGKAAVWTGVIDDLWQLGKPVGNGGPWKDTEVKAGIVSDPYLMAFYDKKELSLAHNCKSSVTFKVEVDPTGNGDWMEYASYVVKPREKFTYRFPASFAARWIRFSTNVDARATAMLDYK
ncbi:MAG: hypothetical protein PHG06_19125, partial [Parabacteroides sp.]|nr:hypothetical protein [Parabacteroides sp.]